MTKKALSYVVAAIVIIGIILIVSLSGSANTNGKVTEKETVTIGVTLPLTGDVAFLGIPEQNALMMAKEDFTKDKKFNYNIVIEDDAYDAKKVATNMQKFMSIDNVDLVITFGSLAANVIAPLAESNQVVFIAASASDTGVADGQYGFDFTTTPKKEAEKMAKELSDRGYEEIAIVNVNAEFTEAMNAALIPELNKYEIEVVAEETFNTGTTDFKTGLLKLKKENPEIYVVMMLTPELEVFAKQFKDLEIEEPMTAIEAFGLTEEKHLFEGLWYVDANYPNQEFFDKYKARFGEDPTPYAADVYSIINMVVSTYEKSDTKPSSETIASRLMTINNFDTPFGKVSVSGKGIFETPATVKEIRNGEGVLI